MNNENVQGIKKNASTITEKLIAFGIPAVIAAYKVYNVAYESLHPTLEYVQSGLAHSQATVSSFTSDERIEGSIVAAVATAAVVGFGLNKLFGKQVSAISKNISDHFERMEVMPVLESGSTTDASLGNDSMKSGPV